MARLTAPESTDRHGGHAEHTADRCADDPGHRRHRTWEPALDGVGAVYVTYHPDLAFPGAAEHIGAFAELALSWGARRLVLLSGRGEEGAVDEEAIGCKPKDFAEYAREAAGRGVWNAV